MKDDKWHRGPPPSKGWWPASYAMHPDIYRWWNGGQWSDYACRGDSLLMVRQAASRMVRANSGFQIYWKDRPKNWPERSKT